METCHHVKIILVLQNLISFYNLAFGLFSVLGHVQDLLLYVEFELHRVHFNSDRHCSGEVHRHKVPAESPGVLHLQAPDPYSSRDLVDSWHLQYPLHTNL